ncbi:MAG TPA: glycosyltransferase [Candidatus Dependentiae bacterium]|nr:glycosyltransferase [Candidatus Dependentiae bacterium]
MIKINQFLPTLASGDAIGYETLAIQNILTEWGYESKIYVRDCHANVSKFCIPYSKYKPNKKDLALFHFALGSELSNYIAKLPTKKIMIYHNITPGKYLRGINDSLAKIVEDGREELATLCNKFDLAIGDSEFNQNELKSLGFQNTGVLPLLLDFSIYDVKPSRKILQNYDDDNVNIVFVGKIYPHKKQEDIVKSFYCYKKYINPSARLFLVGHCTGADKYQEMLLQLISDLELDDVYITGFVNNRELTAYYQIADVFLCMSEHEGFCVPLIESMHFDVPIIAYDSTAVPFTLDNSALLIKEKNYLEIAELVDLIVNDQRLRKTVIERQRERVKDFKIPLLKEQLKNHIENVI